MRKACNVFFWVCWLPASSLVAMEFYAREFEGWGAWAAAPLFLLPFFLSFIVTAASVGRAFTELRSGGLRWETFFLICIAASPMAWLAIRRYVV